MQTAESTLSVGDIQAAACIDKQTGKQMVRQAVHREIDSKREGERKGKLE